MPEVNFFLHLIFVYMHVLRNKICFFSICVSYNHEPQEADTNILSRKGQKQFVLAIKISLPHITQMNVPQESV